MDLFQVQRQKKKEILSEGKSEFKVARDVRKNMELLKNFVSLDIPWGKRKLIVQIQLSDPLQLCGLEEEKEKNLKTEKLESKEEKEYSHVVCILSQKEIKQDEEEEKKDESEQQMEEEIEILKEDLYLLWLLLRSIFHIFVMGAISCGLCKAYVLS